MTSPRRPDDGREIEQRLQASWRGAVAQAERDQAGREIVSLSLAAGRRARRTSLAVAGVAALVVVAVTFVAVWSGGQLLGTVATSPSPVESQGVTGSFAPTPTTTASPADGGIPFLDPGQTFPPTVDGQLVVQVGPEADARIAAATDDSPIYVSGWLVDGDWGWTGCSQASRGVPAPDGSIGSECVGTLLRAAADGGRALRVFSTATEVFSTATERPALAPPGPARVQPVLVQVHVRDPRCDGTDCARMPVLDRVLVYGAMRVAPVILVATLPPGGISAEQAVDVARNQIQRYPPPEPGQLPLLRVVVGTGGWLDDSSDRYDRWEWVVDLVSDDGDSAHIVWVDYQDGQALGAGGGPAAAILATQPSDGVSLEVAVGVAGQYLADHPMGSGGDLALLSAEAGPAAVVDEGGAADTTWIWAVTFVTADGYETYTVDVDYRVGTATHAHGGLLSPSP
jgi:hypothetical protein